MMNYPCIYNEEGKCKLYSTVYEHSWCVEGPCDDQTLSNGDRIRAMTDEELAEALEKFQDWGGGLPAAWWIEWLEQPAEKS